MLSRRCLQSKYRAYTKCFHTSQRDFSNKNGQIKDLTRLADSDATTVSSKGSNALQHAKTESSIINICKRTLSTVQKVIEQGNSVYSSKRSDGSIKDKGTFLAAYHNIQNTLFKNKFLYGSIATGVVGREVDPEGSTVASNQTETLASSSSAASNVQVIDPIPEPPPVPEVVEEVLQQVNALGEPTFASLGLGGASPVGWVQHCFEYLHVTLGIPWWEAVVIGTIIIRFCLFPLVVIAQRNAAKMNNYLPQMQVIQLKMTEARQTGNQLETARYSQELMSFMKEKGLNPFKNMLVPLAQAPVFISFFVALRQMANTPVESMRTGGILWFTDLTVPDQYYLMPLITSTTLWLTIELGTDTARLSAQNLQTMKYVLRALPLIILPFTVNFPGAILCYWVSSNFISLAQVGLLRVPAVRDYFKIEPLLTHKPEHLPIKPKGFTEGIKDSWTNMKITNELEERKKLDELQFQRAGKGPIVKTFKFDPTKQANPNAINAKKR